MNNIGGESKFIGFLDECGDHSMEKIDEDFPLFVLALVIFERVVYPCARHILDWQKPNPAFQIVRKHFYAGKPFGGFKWFP